MYQNLVRAVQPEAYESVHHGDWPMAEEGAIDSAAIARMDLTRRIASLGLSARNSVNIKVRQPLAKALVHVGGYGAIADIAGDRELLGIVADELNVKAVEFVTDEAELVTYRLVPDGRQLGPKFGPRFPAVRQALGEVDATVTAKRLQAGEAVALSLDGETVEVAPEEVLIETQPAEGLAVASERGVTVAIDATLTDDLRREGLVRDIVRYVQALRRDADYALDDRITVGLFALDDEARAAVAQFEGYLCGETLCEELVLADDGRDWDAESEEKLGGGTIRVAVQK
jgi:isoleucyl-tRNA synthetase